MAGNSKKTAKRKTGGARGPGRPFKKGKSGNPSGRPKTPPEIRELAREHGPRALERAIALMKNRDPAVALRACGMVMDRAYGKSAQPFVGADDHPPVIESTEIDDKELARRNAFILHQADPARRDSDKRAPSPQP